MFSLRPGQRQRACCQCRRVTASLVQCCGTALTGRPEYLHDLSHHGKEGLSWKHAVQGFHLEYLRYGDSDKQAGRGKKHGTMDRLLRLANDAMLREELTSFPLAPDAKDAIPAIHRSGMRLHASKTYGVHAIFTCMSAAAHIGLSV